LVAVLALGGGGAAYRHWRPQILSWWQPPAPAAPTFTGPAERPVDTSPMVQPTPGWVWFFDESEWRVTPDEKREFVGGLLHTRQSMEKPQSQADGAIRARMTIRDGAGGVGVFLRSTPEHGRYRLFLDPDLRTIRLVHEGPDQTVELGQHRLTKSLLKGDRILLELRADGLDILGSVNEMLVIQAEDKRSKGKGTWGIDATDGWFELVEVPMPKPLVAEAKPAEPKPAEAKPADGKPAEPKPMPETAPAYASGSGEH
jgi:hypothetical protein